MSGGLLVPMLIQNSTEVSVIGSLPGTGAQDEEPGHRFPQYLSPGCQGQAQTQPGSFHVGSLWACPSAAPGSASEPALRLPQAPALHGFLLFPTETLNMNGRHRLQCLCTVGTENRTVYKTAL